MSTAFGRLTRTLTPERPVDVSEIVADPVFRASVAEVAGSTGRPEGDVAADARLALETLDTGMNPTAVRTWRKIGATLLAAYDLHVDQSALARLRELDRKHCLVWLPSHRSMLDPWFINAALDSSGISPVHWFGGANMSFFPLGQLGRQNGTIFIPRRIADDPVQKLALRHYVGRLARNRANLAWSIEGGRTRTGKLRPPKYGLLRYFADAVEAVDGPEVLLVPVSIVYDQLHEVAATSAEAHGFAKRPESLTWLIRFARQQRERLGDAYLDIGEPVRLRDRIAAESSVAGTHVVERIALQVCHRINEATPATLTGAISLALLTEDRALTVDEVVSAIEPTARYLQRRHSPVAGGGSLTDRKSVRRALDDMRRSGVVRLHEAGTEAVFGIAPGQHLIAAFYRNTMIHLLVDRAIAELALLTAADAADDAETVAFRSALDLRELLKFEFFFADRADFAAAMQAELAMIDPEWDSATDDAHHRVRGWLHQAGPHVAHVVLRPYLDAYQVFADRLAAQPTDEPVDTTALLQECLGVGEQQVLQKRIASAESVTLELFRTALRLAEHRQLVAPNSPELARRRDEFAAEISAARTKLTHLSDTRPSKGQP